MGTMIPNLTDKQLEGVNSNAERKMYKAFRDNLPDDYIVLFEVSWIMKEENQRAKDGETDFVICHPNHGYLCVEVKGGGVSFDSITGRWYSIDKNGNSNEIKDPYKQSLRCKYSIKEKLEACNEWSNNGLLKTTRGHAVFFPDIHKADQLIQPNMPKTLIGISGDINNLKGWVESCFTYWTGRHNGSIHLGQNGINIIKKVFARSIYVKALLSLRLDNEEKERLKLTKEQIRILDILKKQRRVLVSGGAGTGKTVIAVEKAKRLAYEGFKTLLTCYNRALADFLSTQCSDIENLTIMSFHQLCDECIRKANQVSYRNLMEEARSTYPDGDEFNVLRPFALIEAIDILEERFDAIICDEGQDFGDEYWFPIEMMLSSEKNSPLYIFYDDNQNIFLRDKKFPISGDSYTLSKNCRNTNQIHEASYKYYIGDSVEPSGMDGIDIQFETAINVKKQALKINTIITNLLIKEKVLAEDIAILIVNSKYKNDHYNVLEEQILPNGKVYSTEKRISKDNVMATTVAKFKGLEAKIIFLWGLDHINFDDFREKLYVGLSRAKSIVYIVGNGEVEEKYHQIQK